MLVTTRGELSPEKAQVLDKLREQELSLDKQSDAIRKMISTLDDRRIISSSKQDAVRIARSEAVSLTSSMCEEMKGNFSEPSSIDPFDYDLMQPHSHSQAVRDLIAMRAARDEALKDRLMQRRAFLTNGVTLGSGTVMDSNKEDLQAILMRRGKRSANSRPNDGYKRSDDGYKRSDDGYKRSDDGYKRFQPSGAVHFDLEPPVSRAPDNYTVDDAVSMSLQQLARIRTDREMVTTQRLQDRKESLERMHLQRLHAMEEARHGRSMAAAQQLFAEGRQRTVIHRLRSRRQARSVLHFAAAASAWRRVGICFSLLLQRTIHRRDLSSTATFFRLGLAWRRFLSRFRRRVHVHLLEMTRCVLSYSCRLHRFFRRFHLEASVLRRRRRTTHSSIDSHRMHRACGRALSLLRLNVRLFQRYDAATMYYDDDVVRRRLQSALAMLFQFAAQRRRQRVVEEEWRWELLKSSFVSWLVHTEAHHHRAASVDQGVRFAPRYAAGRVLSRWQHRSVLLGRAKRSIAAITATTARGSSLLLKRRRWLRRRVRGLMQCWAARIRLVRRRLSLRVRWMRHVRRKYLHRWRMLSRMRRSKRLHGSTWQLAFQRGIALFLGRWLSRMRQSKRLQQLGIQGHLIKQSTSTHLHRWHSNIQRSRRLFVVSVLRSRRLSVERVALALWHDAIAAKMARRCSHRRVIRKGRLKRGWRQFYRTMRRLQDTRSRQLVLTAFQSSERRTKRRAVLAEAIATWQLFVRCRRGRRRTGRSKLMIRLESRVGRCLNRLIAAAVRRLSRHLSVSIGNTRMYLRAFKTFRAVLTGRVRSSRRVRAAIWRSMKRKATSLVHRWGRAAVVLATTRRRHEHLLEMAALDKKACALRWWCERCRSGQQSGGLIREASMHRACRSLQLSMCLWRTYADEQMQLWEQYGRVEAHRCCVQRGSHFGRWRGAVRLATGRRLARDAAAALREWKLLGLSFHRLLRCAATKDIQCRTIERYRRELLDPMLQRRALQTMRAMLVSSRIGEEDVGGHFSVSRSCRRVLSLLAVHRRERSSLQCHHVLAVGSHRRSQTESAISALRRLVAAARGHARAWARAWAFRLRQTVRPVLLRWRGQARASLRQTAAAQGAHQCFLQRKLTSVLQGLVSYRRRVESRQQLTRTAIRRRANHSYSKCLRELQSRAKQCRLYRTIKLLFKARRDKHWKTIIFGAFWEAYRRESKVLTVGTQHWSRRRSRSALVSLAATVRRGRMRTDMHRRMHLRTARRYFRTSFVPLLHRRRQRTAMCSRADQLRCLRFLRRWMIRRSSSTSCRRRIVSPSPAAIKVMKRSELHPTRSWMVIAAAEAHRRTKRAAQVLARLRSAVYARQHTRIAEIVTDRRLHLSLLHDCVSQWIRHCSHATSARLEATALLQQCDRRHCDRGLLTWKKWFSLRCSSKYGGVHYMRRLLSHHLRTWTTYAAVRRHCFLSANRQSHPLFDKHSLFDKHCELCALRRHLRHWRRWNTEVVFRCFRLMRHSALHYVSRLFSSSFKALAARGKLVRERFRQARASHTEHLLKRGYVALVQHQRLRRGSRVLKRMALRKVFSHWANVFRLVLGVGRFTEVIARLSCCQSLRWALHQWSCDVLVERSLSTHLLGLRIAREESVLQAISAHGRCRRGQRRLVVEGESLNRRRLLVSGYSQWKQRLLDTVQRYRELSRTSWQHWSVLLCKKAVWSLLLPLRRRRSLVAIACHRRHRLAAAAVAALQRTALAGRHRRQLATKALALLLKSSFDRLLEALRQGRSGENQRTGQGQPWQQLGEYQRHREYVMRRQCFSSLKRLSRQGREERRRYRSTDQHLPFLRMRDCFRKLLSHCRLRCLKRRNSDLLRQHWLNLRVRQAVSKLDLNAAASWARKSHLRLMGMHSSSTDLRRGLLAMRAGAPE